MPPPLMPPPVPTLGLVLSSGLESVLPLEPVVPPPLMPPPVPTLGLVLIGPMFPPPLIPPAVPRLGEVWDWLGCCQLIASRGVRVRARIKVLIFNMVILSGLKCLFRVG